MFTRRAQISIVWVIFVIIGIFYSIFFFFTSDWECKVDDDCAGAQYCGSDRFCHDIPVVEVASSSGTSPLISAALIIGLAIVIAAIILRNRGVTLPSRNQPIEKEEVTEPASTEEPFTLKRP